MHTGWVLGKGPRSTSSLSELEHESTQHGADERAWRSCCSAGSWRRWVPVGQANGSMLWRALFPIWKAIGNVLQVQEQAVVTAICLNTPRHLLLHSTRPQETPQLHKQCSFHHRHCPQCQ